MAFEIRLCNAPLGHKWAPLCANDNIDRRMWWRIRFLGSCRYVSKRLTWSGMSTNVAHDNCVNESRITTTKFSDGYFGNRFTHKVLTRAAVLASWCICLSTGINCNFMPIGVCNDSIMEATFEHILIANVLKENRSMNFLNKLPLLYWLTLTVRQTERWPG